MLFFKSKKNKSIRQIDSIIKQLEQIAPKDPPVNDRITHITLQLKELHNLLNSSATSPVSGPKTDEESNLSPTPPKLTGHFKNLQIQNPLQQVLNYQAPPHSKKPTLAPGSEGEHHLQNQCDTKPRALNFYNKQVLDYLAPKMQEFILDQEFMFIATADNKGECDCTSKFGKPGFIRVLNEKYVIYPEYRGNGVMANLGNITENPHIALLIMDFEKDTIGLHVNGKAKILENSDVLQFSNQLPACISQEIHTEGHKKPERWIMVEVEEAYVQCSKHIPLMRKMDKLIDWGTDSDVAKRVDYFQLQDIPLYNRVGGDKAMNIAVDLFYRKVLSDPLVAPFFDDVDMDAQRQKQKAFLAMAFGGPYQYSGLDLRKAHQRLVDRLQMNDQHFDRIIDLLKETLHELDLPEKPVEEMMAILESTRHDVLCR
jgi:truncated hemoglobin YjbI